MTYFYCGLLKKKEKKCQGAPKIHQIGFKGKYAKEKRHNCDNNNDINNKQW